MEQVFVFKVDQKTVVNRNVIEAPVAGVHQTIQLHCNIYISKLKYKKCVQTHLFRPSQSVNIAHTRPYKHFHKKIMNNQRTYNYKKQEKKNLRVVWVVKKKLKKMP